MPPPAPRSISNRYVGRILAADPAAIFGGIFAFIGTIFTVVGLIITVTVGLMGLIFLSLGLLMGGIGWGLLGWRYRIARRLRQVLQEGQATQGEIISVAENYSVQVNQRHPWVIRYRFQLNGQDYEGQVSTLQTPASHLKEGKATCVLYLPGQPEYNALYPHPG